MINRDPQPGDRFTWNTNPTRTAVVQPFHPVPGIEVVLWTYDDAPNMLYGASPSVWRDDATLVEPEQVSHVDHRDAVVDALTDRLETLVQLTSVKFDTDRRAIDTTDRRIRALTERVATLEALAIPDAAPDLIDNREPDDGIFGAFTLHIVGQIDGVPYDQSWTFPTGQDEMRLSGTKSCDLTIRRIR